MDNNILELSFEEAISKLENIVKDLEKGDLTLDESLEEFQEGIQLYRHCNEILNKTEGKIKVILEDNAKDITELDYDNIDF
ncbi:exodeoxyribonuclease 7 small subunit XseB [Gottschalkia purinilytica]|uniref:Exodeoxyribonuclease 7 small subunit n=1 Tax=Gottschalkia purinilytica TaxID=1503 RepID=A0A0L0W7Y0_GOTPU|nr:exodeoxyribonuclease VII small subunit [Gottschalkia purinilytica]KNF07405.1 exodeoxyribonuclease 7 small subunit XseB [Gottschalkia purinilytica]